LRLSRNRKLTTSLLSLAFVATGAVIPNPATAVEAWQPDVQGIEAGGFRVDYSAGNELLFVEDSRSSMVSAVYSYFGNDRESIEVCADVGPNLDCEKIFVDPDAPGEDATEEELAAYTPPQTAAVEISGTALLPYCSGVIESCIEVLEILDPETQEFSAATYLGTTAGTHFRGNPEKGIPSGAGPAIFESTIEHTGGYEYTVQAGLTFAYSPDKLTWNGTEAREFLLEAFATKKKTGSQYRPGAAEVCLDTVDNKAITACVNEVQSSECVYADTGVCGVEHEMAPGTVLRVTLILTNELTGWFRGRLKAPGIEVTPFDDMYSRVVISGESVQVPRFLATFSLAKGDPDIVGPLEENGHGGPFTLFSAASPRAMEIVQGMRERVNDTAAGISTIWSISSINANEVVSGGQGAASCLEDNSRLLGLVTTNAMTYLGTAPTFDSGYLSYKVAGLHYAPDGETVNEGTYDLVMRSDVARCLYGFKNAPVSATVAVVGENGEEKVATTIVSEKDGWLKLAAYGFTFSEKEIQVQLRQSQIKTLTNFTSSSLSAKQKAEIRSVLAKSEGNTKFICTGIRYVSQPMSENIKVRARAKAACEYAKSINPNFSYWYQTKTTQARSYNGKVMVVSKG
jgi:hypothetical protein